MRYTLTELKNKFEYDKLTGDVYILNSGRWKKRVLARAISSEGYYRSNVIIRENTKIALLIHRVAYELHNNTLLGTNVVDHIDHNKLNNKPKNLRAVSRSINNKNLGLKKSNKHSCNNIEKTSSGKYRARITVEGKRIHLGTFSSLKQATEAKFRANKKYGFHKNHK